MGWKWMEPAARVFPWDSRSIFDERTYDPKHNAPLCMEHISYIRLAGMEYNFTLTVVGDTGKEGRER